MASQTSRLVEKISSASSISEYSTFKQFLQVNRNERFCNDIKLNLADDKIIETNRLLVSYCSPKLRKIIKNYKILCTEINLEELNFEVMQAIIDYMHTDSIVISDHNAEEVLRHADFLKMDDLKNISAQYLTSKINPTNCFELEEIAKKYDSKVLKDKIVEYTNKHFDHIACETDFTSISEKKFEIFVDFHCNICSQKSLYNCIVNWVKADIENRNKNFPYFFKKIFLLKLSPEFLRNEVSKEVLVTNNHECSLLLIQALTQKLQSKCDSGVVLYIAGGSYRSENYLYSYAVDKRTWRKLKSIPHGRRSACGALISNCLYFIGGIDSNDLATDRLDCYDIDEDKWTSLQSMNNTRFCSACCVHNDKVFVVGGSNSELMCTGEVYNPEVNKWSAIPSLKFVRTGHSLVSYQGSLLCLGGHDGNNYLKKVDRLENNVWVDFPQLQTCRRWFACVVVHNTIYAIGGRTENDTQPLKTVEKYDSITESWKMVSPMKDGRDSFAAYVVDDNFIYVVGGNGKDNDVGKSIEVYDVSMDKWSFVCKSQVRFANHVLVCV